MDHAEATGQFLAAADHAYGTGVMEGLAVEKEEVVRALVKTFGLGADMPSLRNIRQIVDAVWCVFDPDGSGAVDRREFLMRDGLADTIVASAGAWRT